MRRRRTAAPVPSLGEPMLFCVALVLAACSGAGTGRSPGGGAAAPPRSPSLDYPPSGAQSSDGELVGADRQDPDEKRATGPQAGSPGLSPAPTPAAAPLPASPGPKRAR